MRKFLTRFFLIMAVLSLTGCPKMAKQQALPAHMIIGETYYTQFAIRYEKNRHLTTNYRRGPTIPVNTRVNLLSVTAKAIEVQPENMTVPLTIRNVPKHTGKDVYQAFDDLFAKDKINLNRFTSLERKHIKSGTVAKGMRKKAVTVAIGYPPVTETPGPEADTWVYWSGRFNKFNVNFRNGKVSSIVD